MGEQRNSLILFSLGSARSSQVAAGEWRFEPASILASSQFFPRIPRGGFCRLRVIGSLPSDPVLLFTASFAQESIFEQSPCRILGFAPPPPDGNPPVSVVSHLELERFFITAAPLHTTDKIPADLFKRLFVLLSVSESASNL